VLEENDRLHEEIKNLLQAAEAGCLFARQPIADLQAKHNAKKKDKHKRSSTKAEWLTSEANRARMAEEKAEREKKEAEEKVVKEQKEAEARKW